MTNENDDDLSSMYDDSFDKKDSSEDPLSNDKDDFSYTGSGMGGESIPDKPTIDKFYDTEAILLSIEKTFMGYKKENNKWIRKNHPIARDEFVLLIINSLRSVINPQNMVSKKTPEDIEVIMWEKNQEFVDLCQDELTLDDDIIETVINIYDHSLELFMGLVAGGHGAQTLKEIYAGVAHSVNHLNDQRESGTFRLAIGQKDIVNIGMKK